MRVELWVCEMHCGCFLENAESGGKGIGKPQRNETETTATATHAVVSERLASGLCSVHGGIMVHFLIQVEDFTLLQNIQTDININFILKNL